MEEVASRVSGWAKRPLYYARLNLAAPRQVM